MKTIEQLIIERKQKFVELAVLRIAINKIQNNCEHEFEIAYSAMLYDVEECRKCKFERDRF